LFASASPEISRERQSHPHSDRPDGTIIGPAPGAAPGEHGAAIFRQHPPRLAEAQSKIVAAMRTIQQAVAQLPVLDSRRVDAIIGYDENTPPA
jgi:hypothetical protein